MGGGIFLKLVTAVKMTESYSEDDLIYEQGI